MSEQRFTYDNPIGFGKGEIVDNLTGETFEATMNVILNLLNKQDVIIRKQDEKIVFSNVLIVLSIVFFVLGVLL